MKLMRSVVLVGAVAFAAGCASDRIDWDHWGLAPVPEDVGEVLEARAHEVESVALDRYVEDGLLWYRAPIESDEVRNPLADQLAWTSHLIAALCFRAVIDPRSELADHIHDLVRGVEDLESATGVPGFFARCRLPRELAISDLERKPDRWMSCVDDASHVCRIDTSKDQYASLIFGLVAAARLAPESKTRTLARDLIRRGALHIVREDVEIRGVDGDVTEFGDLEPRIVGLPIAVHGAIVLAWIRAAESLSDTHLPHASRHESVASGALSPIHIEFLGFRNDSNDLMVTAPLAALLLHEQDGETRRAARAALADLAEAVAGEGNPFHVSVCRLSGHPAEAYCDESLRNLFHAPWAQTHSIQPAPYDDLVRRWLPGRKWKRRAKSPLPLAARPMTSYRWRSDPYALEAERIESPTERFANVDWLTAYWFGRYTGWIPAPRSVPAASLRSEAAHRVTRATSQCACEVVVCARSGE